MSETNRSPGPAVVDAGDARPPATERKRILLVEGDGFTRLVLLLRLRLAGFGVDFTSNGILGVQKLRACNPDILLVELKLCGMSGLDLIKAARAEPAFGQRPIYVFTHVSRMNRAARKEMAQLDAQLFDKSSITREDLVQIFATTFLNRAPAGKQSEVEATSEPAPAAVSEVVLSGAIEELISGVRDQSELFAQDKGDRGASGTELLSRVSSLASCAKAAGLTKLAQHAHALEKFLNQLCSGRPTQTHSGLATVTRAVDVMSRMSFSSPAAKPGGERFSAVYIDEAAYSNRAAEESLLNAGFQPVCFEDPGQARQYLSAHPTQLIIANVVLPEAHGLSVADIRQLPLHSKTPVLFGPEPTLAEPTRDQLPTSATRLDKAPLLLTELVVRALNEVQSPMAPAPKPTQQPALPPPRSAATLPREDGYELFAQAVRQQDIQTIQAAVQSASLRAQAIQQPVDCKPLFTVEDIPSEPIFRVEPDIRGAEHEADFRARVAATTEDGIQPDERPVEELPPAAPEAESGPVPQAEPMAEDQAALAAESAAAGEITQLDYQPNTASAVEVNEWNAEPQSATATPNYGEVMNNQLQAEPANELEQSQRPRVDLASRVCEAEMALYQAQAELQEKDKAIEELQNRLADHGGNGSSLSANAAGQGSDAEQKAQARCTELEQEILALRQAFEGLNGGFTEQQNSAEATGRMQELEQRLNQQSAELDKQKEEQRRAEAELRQQLEAAEAARQQHETGRQQAEGRCAQLEQEMTALRQAAQEQKARPEQGAARPQPAAGSKEADGWTGAPASDLEEQVKQGVAALARATVELAKERGERQRTHQLATELNGRLQALHQDLNRTLQTQGEHLSRISALEQQHQQTQQELERRAADLEQQQAERRLAEEQLQTTKQANAQLRKDLSFYEQANNKFDGARQDLHSRLEANLNSARELESRLQQERSESQRLAQSLEEAQREVQNQARRREALEQELKAAREELQQRDAKLQNAAAERERLAQEQESSLHGLQDRSERDLEFSKLQSALQLEQVERKRQETQLARIRQRALDAAHAARALRTGLRRQIREPVDNLVQSTRSLLELPMGDDQKKLAEAVLQDVLLVQTRLREPAAAHGDAAESSAVTPTSAE